MRLLPARNDDGRNRTAQKKPKSDRGTNQSCVHYRRPLASSLPLRQLHRHHRCRKTGRVAHGEGEVDMPNTIEKSGNIFEATLSRRQFVKTGGALVVGVAFVGPSV